VRRTAVMFAVWLLGVSVATAVAWNAVGLVGSEVTDSASQGLSPGEVGRQLAGATGAPTRASPRTSRLPSPATARPSTGQSAPPRTSAPPPDPTAPRRTVSKTFILRGGTAAVSCTGEEAVLDYASPNSGFEVDDGGAGDEVAVRFRSEDHESRLRVECVGGTPVGEIREDD
jgi:hypothetical protein